MMHRVEIIRRAVTQEPHRGRTVWQGGTVHMVDAATLHRLIDEGAVEIKMQAGAPENKAGKRRGRPRKVQA